MTKKYKRSLIAVVLVGILVLAAWYLHRTNIPVLEPRGTIGLQERQLIITASLLALIVVIPVFVLLFGFAWRYREGNYKARYSPELAGNHWAETTWWVIPSIIIVILSVITWNSSHTLDPYRPISSKTPALTIEVVALDWKWLFIYPQQNIASVNFFQFPVNTPLHFEITSDTVMNSFWIPQLGGQIYAMPGMATQLNLMASSAGNYAGSSANISGTGFAGMTFTAAASSASSFNDWVQTAQYSSRSLTTASYNALAQPSQNNPRTYYSVVQPGLFDWVIMKYMMPAISPPAAMNTMNTGNYSPMGMSGMGM